MSSLQVVQIAMERKSGTTTAAGRLSTAEEKRQEQGKASGERSWFSAGADPQRTPGQTRPKQQRSQVGGHF